ncbi:fatty acyl-CoA reductase 1-like isoform X1 [Varroa jacobsoni]|uniref:Fatty acyl-CoA reductase n=2 Tax=Varroa TaxID=62624 RepID=A0A7M7JQJ8_VARDE|nr:fatty acyl-CoA reductase 1-like isoform X1 [Varroa destructor]XP_022655398.1 fatty acyl-CoA reductase 1-like isoform X1 [Varroa destructor]XP_022703739.1 fatty acyl-CoA reductase 1-like isoform X1 [Varroa jacobsoni]XP_022703746.1 fatty acyl-CoA reductase 1-like isoform X1 [Varroa jacobsoni]
MTSNLFLTNAFYEYVGVREYLSGKNLFITGCTGFVGKVLLEKILRSCPDVASIYVLGREKKGHSLQQRFTDIFNSALFDRVRKENPTAIEKVKMIEGDMLHEGLGIYPSDLQKLRSCINVVMHNAASVRFDEPLRNAVRMNLFGTKRILELCATLDKLEVLVHVSTCYANCDLDTIEEKIYPQEYEPEQIMRMVEWLDDEALESVQKKLLGNKPNTYTFTKGLAETMIKQFHDAAMTRYEQSHKEACSHNKNNHNSATVRPDEDVKPASIKKPFAISIVRPSIVVGSLAEPVPGWVDNYNGPNGMVLATALGVLRSIYSKKEMRADFIPVDIVANTILVVAWHTGMFRPQNVLVYNCAAGDRAPPLTWADFENYQGTLIAKVTFNKAFRYPKIHLRGNWILHRTSMLLEHYVPAYVMDKIYQLLGKEPQFMKMYDKLTAMQNALTFFTTNQWCFRTEKVERLRLCLSDSDRQEFCTEVSNISWISFLHDYVRGLRDFVLKENHKHSSNWFQRLYLYEQLIKVGFAFAVYKMLGIGNMVASVYDKRGDFRLLMISHRY